jgi:putative transposase
LLICKTAVCRQAVATMLANKAYRFRLYPNNEQAILIDKTIGSARFIYNKMLSDKIEHYNETKTSLRNTPAQYKDEFEWLREVDSFGLCYAQMALETAYRNFFRSPKTGFPNFKAKNKVKWSYSTYVRGDVVFGNKVKLPKLGLVSAKVHREVTGVCKTLNITKTRTNKYYISILTEYEKIEPTKNIETAIGLDYSSKALYIDSNGNSARYPRFFRGTQTKLARRQRELSGMKLGSNNYCKQKIRVALVHEKIANQRKDFLEKLSYNLSQDFDLVCLENLDMKAMAQCLKLGKSTNDNGFGMFVSMLERKCKATIKVDRWFPSSKLCSECGYKNKELKLSDREWKCAGCNCLVDRDHNAAVNILREGINRCCNGDSSLILSRLLLLNEKPTPKRGVGG